MPRLEPPRAQSDVELGHHRPAQQRPRCVAGAQADDRSLERKVVASDIADREEGQNATDLVSRISVRSRICKGRPQPLNV